MIKLNKKEIRASTYKKLTRGDLVALIGEDLVTELDDKNCLLTGATANENGDLIFVSRSTLDGEYWAEAVYYQNESLVLETEDLNDLDWAVDHYVIY